MKNIFRTLFCTLLVCSAAAQDRSLPKPPDETPSPIYTLTEEEKAAGWKILFDGKNNLGLRGLTHNDWINRGWKIGERHTIFCEKTYKQMGLLTGGHLITAGQYLDFEFVFEWKLSVSGKSGIMYFAGGTREKPVGFVYTIVDDTHNPDSLKGGPIKHSASLYGILPPGPEKKLDEPGQWNRGKIVVQGNQIEHWLNDAKVLEFTLGSPQLQGAIASYAKDAGKDGVTLGPLFGRKFKTALVILDEGEEVEFRNLRVRPLSVEPVQGTTFAPTPR